MTSVDPKLRATKTTCPYCGVGCGVLATPDGNGGAAISGDPEHPGQFRPAVLQGLGARRDPGAREPAAASDGPLQQGQDGARGVERRARPCRASLAAHRRARRRQGGRVLSLRPDADRGLLRRQQADEGVSSARPMSTPIRGSAWPRRSPAIAAPSAPTPCPAATRISTRPICWCWSAPTPPGAIRCCSSA